MAVVDLRRRVEVGFFRLAEENGEEVVRRREEGFWMREAEVEEEVMRKFDMVVVEVEQSQLLRRFILEMCMRMDITYSGD